MTTLEIALIAGASLFAILGLGLWLGVKAHNRKKRLRKQVAELEAKVDELNAKLSINSNQSIQEFMDTKFKNLSKQEQVSLLLNYIAQLQISKEN